jgi:hypothetical protein
MSHSVPRSGKLLLLAALALLPACTPPVSAPRDGTPSPSASPQLVSSLSVQSRGDTVLLVLRVTNSAEAPVAVTFATGQTYDFAVRDAAGHELWRWSGDRGFTQAVQTRTLAGSETWEFGERWLPPAGTRGELTAEGRLTSSSHPVRLTSVFRLP